MAALLLLVASRTVRAQSAEPSLALEDYQVSRWTTAEGLPQNTVNGIAALPTGELWLASFGGLVRFDGTRFHVVDIARSAGLPSNRITAIAPAGAAAAWFVTQEGDLGHLDHGSVRTLVHGTPGMPDVVALTVVQGQFYSQTEEGSLWRTDGTAPWVRVHRASPEDAGGLNFLANTRDGLAWATFKYTFGQLTPTGLGPRQPMPDGSLSVALGPGGRPWFGLERGVARFVDGHVRRLDVRPALTTPTTALLPISEDEAWVAGAGDVSHLRRQPDGTWRRRRLPLDLPSTTFMRALVLDGEGSLWIGTTGHGLFRAYRLPARRFGEASGLAAIEALASDGAGGAWVSSSCTGIYHISSDGEVRQVTTAAESGGDRLGGCLHAFATDRTGAAWVRSERQLYSVQRNPVRITRAPVDLPDENGPIVVARDGSLWVASRQGDVRRITATGDRVLEQRMLEGPLVSAVVGPDDTLWVGGTGQVFHVSGDRVRTLEARDGVPRGSVRNLLVRADGSLLIATYGGGLGYLRDGRMTRITDIEGLPDNALSHVVDDGRGRVWMSTNRGVAVIEWSELDDLANGTRRTITPVVLGAERGVPEANFGLPAGFADPLGRIWFGTIAGAVRLDARTFPFNTVAPTIRFEGVDADDRALPAGSLVTIPANTARVRLHFGATALLYPERLRFRFRFEGIDSEWVDVGPQRTATWTPSGPGLQRVLLQARNEDGVWNASPIAIDLRVLPAWWQTPAVRLGGIALAALAAIALYRQRVGTLERRHAARVRDLEERRRAEEKAAALRTQLEHVARVALAGELAASLAHEVNQPLTAIVTDAESAQHVLAARGTSAGTELRDILDDIVAQGLRASEVIRGLREFLRTGSPEARPLDLSVLVREMLPLVRRELEDNRVQVVLGLASPLPAIEGRRVQLGQVIVNLVMNACEALAGVSGDRRVVISTAAIDGRVEVRVSDTGPGVPPEVADRLFDPFVTTKPQGMGMGLAICRSIAEAHRGRLTAEPAPGGGLTMVLSLPVAGGDTSSAPADATPTSGPA
jgi:signal transduction histidine kinase/ligand-binding sensor domain-containing protein